MTAPNSHHQPPIHFGGVVLPTMEVGGPELRDYHGVTPVAHANPPAGEETPEARLINVSRIALAARIKHGVPLTELVPHMLSLALVEERLISYRGEGR